ncbi:MAG: hypothetical protein IKS80_04235, partial [Bacteroidaceae bacterium]|nr:hypothetical protein [Bacteroidaceae bacterium]
AWFLKGHFGRSWVVEDSCADDLCLSDSYKKVAFAERFPFWVVSRFEPFINACLQSVTVLTNNRPF